MRCYLEEKTHDFKVKAMFLFMVSDGIHITGTPDSNSYLLFGKILVFGIQPCVSRIRWDRTDICKSSITVKKYFEKSIS